jgi:tetratricopeptide (TPR) repeat protein
LFGSPNPRPAIAWARRALERDPRDVVVQVRLSRLLDRAGDLPQAVRVMERAVELYPTYPAHRLELGELLYRLAGEGGSAERLAAAGEQFRRALELDAARVGEQQRRLTPAQVAWAERRLDEIGEARSAASLPAEE